MKITCPRNETHSMFITTAHVMQEWVIDNKGNFIKLIIDLEVVKGPTKGNIFTCDLCGAEAIVEE